MLVSTSKRSFCMFRSHAVALAALFSISLTAFAQNKGPLAELPSKPGCAHRQDQSTRRKPMAESWRTRRKSKVGASTGAVRGAAKTLNLRPWTSEKPFLFGQKCPRASFKPEGPKPGDNPFGFFNLHKTLAWGIGLLPPGFEPPKNLFSPPGCQREKKKTALHL